MLLALETIGFDVTKIDNANFSTMRKALRDFGRQAQGADIALVYFAGHGMEVDKNNYLIPVDAQLLSDQDVEYEAISIELLNRAIAAMPRAKEQQPPMVLDVIVLTQKLLYLI